MTGKDSAVAAELLEIIRTFKGADFVEPQGAVSALNFFTDLGLDSLEVINLLFQVEQKYGIQISDEDMKKHDLMMVGKMAAFIARQHG
jgi:acyl carrier protein